jgi:hypothetical protein
MTTVANIDSFIGTLEAREEVAGITARDLKDQISYLRDKKHAHLAAALERAAFHNDRELELIQAILADARKLLRD